MMNNGKGKGKVVPVLN